MTNEECFAIWSPEGAEWSAWAKPVLFASMTQQHATAGLPVDWRSLNLTWAPSPSDHTAIVVDVPGAVSVAVGLALADRGYRPVPLFNATAGQSSLVDVEQIMRALLAGALELREMRIKPDAPPAFLLDADRMKPATPAAPGKFDNRWVVFPQDLPSANYLQSRGIGSVLVVLRNESKPAEDLSHILYRWQQGGVPILLADLGQPDRPHALEVKRPSWFRVAWYRAIATMGLRRNNAGGFGAIIPVPTSGG
ncbi:MAG TPA: hypothetical protein VJ596_12610 [Gemmatimonadaceae bacterium]|nr:hypothetical protein [Gemmatimonadaceae bacterium]